MSADLLSRLAARAVGDAPVLQPLVRPVLRGPDSAGPAAEDREDQPATSPDLHTRIGRGSDRRRSDGPGAGNPASRPGPYHSEAGEAPRPTPGHTSEAEAAPARIAASTRAAPAWDPAAAPPGDERRGTEPGPPPVRSGEEGSAADPAPPIRPEAPPAPAPTAVRAAERREPADGRRRPPPGPPPAEPTVRVTIGRIEVRAVTRPGPAAPAPRPQPKESLAEYLRGRGRRA